MTGSVLTDQRAVATLVLWSSGQFSTFEIARLLNVGEDEVCRTLHLARDGARAAAEGGAS